jgi:hypothetical protein
MRMHKWFFVALLFADAAEAKGKRRKSRRVTTSRARLFLPIVDLSVVQMDKTWQGKRRDCERNTCVHMITEEAQNCVNECTSTACFDKIYASEPVRGPCNDTTTADHRATHPTLLLRSSSPHVVNSCHLPLQLEDGEVDNGRSRLFTNCVKSEGRAKKKEEMAAKRAQKFGRAAPPEKQQVEQAAGDDAAGEIDAAGESDAAGAGADEEVSEDGALEDQETATAEEQ